MHNHSVKPRHPAQYLTRFQQCSSGFTLIELMIVVAIIAILATIAYPSYQQWVLKSNRGAAKSTLLDLASREEKFLTLNNNYSSASTDLYGAGTTVTFPMAISLSGAAVYTVAAPVITVATATAPATFTITATATGKQVADTTCTSFIMSSSGQQTSTPVGSSCW